VTNLLVGDSHRGRGYSKVLLKAVEGLARSWNCGAIYLHVDADTVSGRIPQELYRGLGYKPVIDKRAQRQYEWMAPELMNLGLYVIDEVPLLFLRKDLDVF
jgi:GNAT superfamily N-acetyltransferase